MESHFPLPHPFPRARHYSCDSISTFKSVENYAQSNENRSALTDITNTINVSRRKMRSIFENESDDRITRFLGDEFDNIRVSPYYLVTSDENCIRMTGNRSALSDITNTVSPKRIKMRSVCEKETDVEMRLGNTKNMNRVPFSTQNVDELYSIFLENARSKKHKAEHDDTLYEVPISCIDEISLRNLTSCEKVKESHRQTRLEHEVDIQYAEFCMGSSRERVNCEQKLDSEKSTEQHRLSSKSVLMSSEFHNNPPYVSKIRKRTRSKGCDATRDAECDPDSVSTSIKKTQRSKRAPSCINDQRQNSVPTMRKRPRRSQSESRKMEKGNRKHQIIVTDGPLDHGIID
ncbi:hypothetical protein RIF29_39360 [Crotalaria pallida]|uniref:Uncharacterized protein n=1 Tax=Crotalaria pallida TaxID=3830 RepID=A0AAN9E7C7_CROPI